MNKHVRLLALAAATSLSLAACATYDSPRAVGTSPVYGSSTASCYDCGTVLRIDPIGGTARSGATGAVIGGLVGAAAGRELADDESKGRRNTATVAGAVAGAAAGSAIQRNVAGGGGGGYNIQVRMNDGRTVVVTQSDLGGIREGSYVRVANGRAWLR